MCLAIPGLVQQIIKTDDIEFSGTVLFGGVSREINFSCVPEVKVGDYIIAHAGVALQILDEGEARKIISELNSLSVR